MVRLLELPVVLRALHVVIDLYRRCRQRQIDVLTAPVASRRRGRRVQSAGGMKRTLAVSGALLAKSGETLTMEVSVTRKAASVNFLALLMMIVSGMKF